MAGVLEQDITDRWAIYNADCIDVLAAIPDESIHASIYSPPFSGLYQYSSNDRDLSNARDYQEFWEHYGFIIREKFRVTMPGRHRQPTLRIQTQRRSPLKHASAPSSQDVPSNGSAEGTFHHLIALFCTVSANTSVLVGLATNFCNEINDLGAFLHLQQA